LNERPPLNLCIVLDKSGSMGCKNKLVNAKESILQVLQSLRENDILHLVTYSDVTDVVLQNTSFFQQSYELIKQKVASISADGCTNLMSGIEEGVRLLAEHKLNGYNSRLFLFSDGLINIGESNHTTIMRRVSNIYEEKGIQISAFGIGDDFDEKIIRGISESGLGLYFYVENSNSIPSFVSFALSGLKNNICQNAVLQIKGIHSGTAIKFYGKHSVMKGAQLGDLSANNVKSLMTQIEVRPNEKISDEVLHCVLTYERNSQTHTIMSSMSINFTDDRDKIQQINPEVRIKLALDKISVFTEQIANLENGKSEIALKLQQEQIAILEEVEGIDNLFYQGENHITQMLELARKSLTKLKEEGITNQIKKETHSLNYAYHYSDKQYDNNYFL